MGFIACPRPWRLTTILSAWSVGFGRCGNRHTHIRIHTLSFVRVDRERKKAGSPVGVSSIVVVVPHPNLLEVSVARRLTRGDPSAAAMTAPKGRWRGAPGRSASRETPGHGIGNARPQGRCIHGRYVAGDRQKRAREKGGRRVRVWRRAVMCRVAAQHVTCHPSHPIEPMPSHSISSPPCKAARPLSIPATLPA